MPCGRFKRVRQAEVVSPEFNAFKRKLKLTILMTLATEKRHDHPEVGQVQRHTEIQNRMAVSNAVPAVGVGNTETGLLAEQLHARRGTPIVIPRKPK